MKNKIIMILIAVVLLALMIALSIVDRTIIEKQIKDTYPKSILIIGDVGSVKKGGAAPVYNDDGESAEKVAELQYNCAVIAGKGFTGDKDQYAMIPADLPNMESTGYVASDKVRILSYDPNKATDNYQRNKILSEACSHIGLKFVRYGKSLTTGIDCSNFVRKMYATVGITLPETPKGIKAAGSSVSEEQALPGDVVFYDVNNGEGHVGMYLGKGLIINAAGHAGKEYPQGGVRICCLQYKDRETYEFIKIIK